MKAYLIGAGASYGHRIRNDGDDDCDDFPSIFCPPTSCNIFIRAAKLGMLTKDSYPFLYEAIQTYLEIDSPLEEIWTEWLRFDIEEFLVWVIEDYDRSDRWSFRNTNFSGQQIGASEAVRGGPIGGTYDFLYDFFRFYSCLYSPQFYCDNYQRLIQSLEDETAFFISMNYDTLLEQAIMAKGYKVVYDPITNYPGDPMLVLKPHGSVNWLYPNLMGSTKSVFQQSLQTDNVVGNVRQEVKVLSIEEIRSLSSGRLPPLREPFLSLSNASFIPAMIPPFGDKKEKQQFGLSWCWDAAAHYLSLADELVIIGCSLRKQDVALRDLLKDNLADDVKVEIAAGPDSDDIKDNLERWLRNPSCETHGYFEGYLYEIGA